jgi:hypothetical protein
LFAHLVGLPSHFLYGLPPLELHFLDLAAHVPGLSSHPTSLGMNIVASLAEQSGLPADKNQLQESDSNQAPCEIHEPALYLEVLATLLAGLIAGWGGWLYGGGNRAWGGLVIALSLWLFLSSFTGFLFNDPLFWRPLGSILTGHNPYRCQEQTDYRQTFQHDAENVSQKPLDLSLNRAVFSSQMTKPSPIEFLKAAGWAGATSAVCSIASFAVAYVEHENGRNVPTEMLTALGCGLFCWGAFLAWANERKRYNDLQEQQLKADIRCELYRASVDTKRFDEHGQPIQIDDGVCISLLMKAVNHGHDAYFGPWPTLQITFGAKTYQGESTRLPENPWVLQYDDMSLFDRRVGGLFQALYVNAPSWPHGLPRTGTVSFIVRGVDHNIMNVNTLADIEITILDSLDNPHPSKFNNVQILKGLIQQNTPEKS